jgi:hypothetical protein
MNLVWMIIDSVGFQVTGKSEDERKETGSANLFSI